MNVKHPATITGHVIRVERHGHTIYGNPTMSVVLSTELGVSDLIRISDNASIVYGIENAEYRDEPHTFALTRAGRLSHVVKG